MSASAWRKEPHKETTHLHSLLLSHKQTTTPHKQPLFPSVPPSAFRGTAAGALLAALPSATCRLAAVLASSCVPLSLARCSFASPRAHPPPLRARAPFSPSSSSPSYSELRPMISSGVTLHPALLFVKRHTRTRRDTDQQQRHLGVLAVLAAIWDRLGVLLGGSFGTSWAVLGQSWRPLGRSWGHLGSLLCRFGPSEGRKGANAKILQTLLANQ